MDAKNLYFDQVHFLVSLLPPVAKQPCFALKGGTAINLFVRDLPRLSVDIDLAYLPVEDRDTSLTAIDQALRIISQDIERTIPRSVVHRTVLEGTGKMCKLLVQQGEVAVKIEVTPVLRGSVYPSVVRELTPQAQATFGYVRMQLLSFEDLYAGKLCAALDRQHPRDLFDVHYLFSNEGMTPRLKDAFLVYVLSHNRSMADLLSPSRKDVEDVYQSEFVGLVNDPVSLDSLYASREELILTIHRLLNDRDRRFLLSFKRGDPDWSLLNVKDVEHLPAVQWKLLNIRRMTPVKREQAVERLRLVLFGATAD